MQTISLPLTLQLFQKVEFPHKLGILDRLYGHTLAERGIRWARTGADVDWKLDLANCTHRWIVYGKYEGPGFHRWARRFLPRNGVVVDSGANIGQMLLYVAQLIPEGRLLAFEPGTTQADWLAECLRHNPRLPVELIRLGLGPTPATVLLADEGLPSTHGAQSFVSDSEGIPIHIVRLEDEINKRGLQRVDLWKLDVEGYEVSALEGARNMLRTQAIGAIYAELHEENGHRIKSHLTEFGYECHSINDLGRLKKMNKLPEHTNGLFLPSISRN